ncbi:MAG: FAD-dependent oxidoreductase [Candidatus Bathyarchaeia archaeon]
MKTAILGGGLTGLTLGYLMKQKDQDIEILEKEPECGGLMRTLEYEGFTFDYCGSHIIFSKNKEVLEFMLNLLGKNRVRNRRNTKIIYKGRLVKYPFENGLSDLSKEENFECLNSFIQNLIRKRSGELGKPTNLKEWCSYTFGEAIAQKYLIPYNEKIWKYPLEQISLEWVERVPNPPVEDIIKASLGIPTEGYLHQLYFYYPKVGGIQALTKSLEKKIGNSITTNFEVVKICGKDGAWRISDGKHDKQFGKIISTIPIQLLVKAIEAPAKIKEAANSLNYNSLITVMLGLKRKIKGHISWLYIPDHTILPYRVSFSSNFSPKNAPFGKSALTAEITCKFEDDLWKKKDEAIVGQVLADLRNLNLIKEEDVMFALTRRTRYAYVINDHNCGKNMKLIRNYFTQRKIALVGRFSEFKYLNMDACIKSAMNYIEQNEKK